MNQMTGSLKGVPWGGFSAVFATALLFTALPLLTNIPHQKPLSNNSQSLYLSKYKPPPPPSTNREEPDKQEMAEKTHPREVEKPERAKPKFDMPNASNMNTNGTVRIPIPVLTPKTVEVPSGSIRYNPNEVDQPPRYLRTVPAQYPFLAKRDHIEGKVWLHFVVDLDGLAKETEVVKAEPEGIFEEAALKAIQRYKFKPAIKDGEAVECNAALSIAFVLE
jgi:protein TonB